MFHDAKAKWPDADLYYIANFKLVSDSVSGKDMDEYYEQARILCAEYGVHYIDLYNDVELYETFDYESESILPDLIHPVSASYDILFPAILRLFNEAIAEEDNNGDNGTITPDNGGNEETTTPDNGNNEPTTPNAGNDAKEEEHTCEKVSGWKSFWNSIANFFRRLFGQAEVCTCGEKLPKKKK